MTRSECLDIAKKTVCQDRNDQYGKPEDNFKIVAEFWGSYLNKSLTPADVANLMILFKIARNMGGVKEDNYVDIAGYAACGVEVLTNDKVHITYSVDII